MRAYVIAAACAITLGVLCATGCLLDLAMFGVIK
jgi:hypothetical protein